MKKSLKNKLVVAIPSIIALMLFYAFIGINEYYEKQVIPLIVIILTLALYIVLQIIFIIYDLRKIKEEKLSFEDKFFYIDFIFFIVWFILNDINTTFDKEIIPKSIIYATFGLGVLFLLIFGIIFIAKSEKLSDLIGKDIMKSELEKMYFEDYLKDNIVVFDGAFGTMLQKKTTDIGTRPERLNLEKPEIVASIYRAYANAGADVISAATFGANAKKIGSYELSEKLIRAGVELAKKTCPDKFIALDLGPTGALLEPSGDTTFEEIYKVYAHAVNAGKHFADVILFETMADLYELKAAVLAARENSDLPIIASMTFEQNMRTFMGVSVESFVISISPLVDAIGVNCSLGPNQLLPVVEKILSLTDKPIIVQANAGLPDSSNNYAVTPENFAEYAKKFVNLGARIIGGCCGTTPDYIKLLRNIADEKGVLLRKVQPYSAVSTARKTVFIEGVCAVSENINPTNKAEMQNALINEDFDYFTDLAFDMADGGAQILDVNCGCAGVDETKILPKLVKHLQAISPLPLKYLSKIFILKFTSFNLLISLRTAFILIKSINPVNSKKSVTLFLNSFLKVFSTPGAI